MGSLVGGFEICGALERLGCGTAEQAVGGDRGLSRRVTKSEAAAVHGQCSSSVR